MNQTNHLVAAFAALTLIAAGCGSNDGDTGDRASPAAGEPASASDSDSTAGSSTLVVAIPQEPTTLDHPKRSDNVKDLVVWRINEPLIDLNTKSQLVPALATEMPRRNPQRPTKWTVPLRKGVTFTNGEPFDAAAVVANVERVLDPEYQSLFATSELSTLASARAMGRYTVEFTTKAPDPVFPYRLPFLRMAPPEYAADWDKQAAAPVGTGPYKFVDWRRGESLRITRNEDYWGPRPNLGEIEFRVIPDQGTRVSALQAGEADLAMGISPDQRENVPQMLVASHGSQVGFIRPDYTQEPFDDLRVRQALNYALDKEGLSEGIYGGAFEPALCQLTPAHVFGSNDALEAVPYDPEKAEELLDEAGVEDGFAFDVIWSESGFGNDRQYAEAVTSMWRAVGLEPNLQLLQGQQFTDQVYAKGESAPDMVYTEVNTPFPHASRAAGIVYDGDGAAAGNVGSIDPEFQQLIDQAFTELDRTASAELYDELQQEQCDNSLFVYLLERKSTWGAAANVHYEPGPELFARIFWEDVTLS